MAPRLIRRRPLVERIKAYLDPVDFLLWLSEQVDADDWDRWQKDCATSFGLGLNVILLLARANSGISLRRRGDDVFGDDVIYTSWTAWFAAFVVHLLSLLSFVNAAYTFYRRRRYRLFENPLNNMPSTPSAHRVRVDSSPVASSPLRFLSSMLSNDNAEMRSHPDAARDVWEIAVWDPTPLSLRMFCLLSPGHILVYWLFLPTAVSDPRPSVTVLTTILLTTWLSAQLLFLQSSFSQQSKDASIIHKEVMNEYDTKFVHPRTQPLMRDVGIQHSGYEPSLGELPRYVDEDESVDTYTPTFVINKGFHTRPNLNYVKHTDPTLHKPTPSRDTSSTTATHFQTPAHLRDMSSPIRPQTAIRQPQFRTNTSGDGGNLGVYTHANSPLRKSMSSKHGGPPGQRDRDQSPTKRESSPLKVSNNVPSANSHLVRHANRQ